VGEFTLLVAYGPHAIVAGAVRGVVPRDLHHIFQDAVDSVHESHLKELINFQGDTSPFGACRPVLERCLLGQGEPQRLRARPAWKKRALVAGIPLVLLALGLTWWVTRSLEQRRWDGYVRRVGAEPGVIVAQHGRDGTRFYIRGLRDPLAADPDALLAGSRFSKERVDSRWEQYHSLQPRFAAERAYLQLKDALERKQFRFRLGSPEIPLEMETQIIEVAAGIRELAEAAARTGRTVRFEVRGDTDPQGSEQFNLTLAQDRARAVAESLTARGVAPSWLALRGRGEGRLPCNAASERERAACRSVSLHVLESRRNP
jgi:outer membrane protein OmpA-like peptidoglycan-associated protein